MKKEITLETIAVSLESIHAQIGGIKTDIVEVKSDIAETKADLEVAKIEIIKKFDDLARIVNKSFDSLEPTVVKKDEFLGVVRRVEVVESKLGIAGS